MEGMNKYNLYVAGPERENSGEIWLIPLEDENMARKMAKTMCEDGYEACGAIVSTLSPLQIRSGFAFKAEKELYRCNECLGRIQGLLHEWA